MNWEKQPNPAPAPWQEKQKPAPGFDNQPKPPAPGWDKPKRPDESFERTGKPQFIPLQWETDGTFAVITYWDLKFTTWDDGSTQWDFNAPKPDYWHKQ